MICLRARYIFPITSPPLQNGVVAIENGRIVQVSSAPMNEGCLDLGNVALLPALINAHTHLEFSQLNAPLGKQGTGMARWIGDVMAYRRQSPENFGSEATRAGLAESLRQGVTMLGEIAQPEWPAQIVSESAVRSTIFLELLAPTAARVDAIIQQAKAHIKRSGHWRPGLSPHSPYSVHPSLMEAAILLAVEHNIPLAFHLAESADEMELLRTAGGPLREFLEKLGAWTPDLVRPGTRPLDYLQRLAQAPRTLIIHGNYLDAEEISFLAEHREQFSVVYCPRTHAWFGHRPYSLLEMLQAGIPVALGTDSRASSPDLSVLAEMRQVARTYPQIPGAKILELGTICGAEALDAGRDIGSLESGKWADLVAVTLPDRVAADPHDLLLAADGPVTAVWCKGIPLRLRASV